jgi:hypothetical protein
MCVLGDKDIVLLPQVINIPIERVVLLFSFKESSYNLIQVGDARVLPYHVESFLDDRCISVVLIKEALLFTQTFITSALLPLSNFDRVSKSSILLS